MTTAAVVVDIDRLAEVTARLDLRPPNREALESLAFEMYQHYSVDGRPAPFEAVIDSATGVGKTFILVGAIEYLASQGFRNFAVIAPGSTIRDKTIAHFTPGHRKSLLDGMDSRPALITADNFESAATRSLIDDDSRVKVYVFTIQSLTAPTTKQHRRTHEYQERLGAGFYQHLSELDDLVVFADEHHCYFGPAFSDAISGLRPAAVVGLTATPDRKTPEDSIIYRYPLAAAIADRWVKTPVIVARRDDLSDPLTKLADGVLLLDFKAKAADAYCVEHSLPQLNPVMMVVAQNTAEADEYAAILNSEEFDGGRWAGTILVVHSNLTGEKKEAALADLQNVEDPDSRVRIIIAVGMLKEGWDVKNVYVIASMRALVSTVLTEQTLGRGLRLPFGRYTDIEMLDTVEVVAHEKYEALLKKAGALNEQFVDKRTRAVLRKNAAGETVAVTSTEQVSTTVVVEETPTVEPDQGGSAATGTPTTPGPASVSVETIEDRRSELAGQSSNQTPTVQQYSPLPGMPVIQVPILKMTKVEAQFSLSDLTDMDAFRKLGHQVAADPETQLRRLRVGAKVWTGPDGLRRTELVTTSAVDKLDATAPLFPLVELRSALVDALLAIPVVPRRKDQAYPANKIIDAFIDGLGANAEHLLSLYGDRAGARLCRLVATEQRKVLAAPSFEEVIELRTLDWQRESKRKVSLDRTGTFSKSIAYDSFSRSLYGVDWFDSEPERAVANIVDSTDAVRCWVRLQTGEMPILWRSDGREYNADMIVVEVDGTHWVVEVKADYTVGTADVQGKRAAAKRWANHVSASDLTDCEWRYLLLTQADIGDAHGSWSALKGFGS